MKQTILVILLITATMLSMQIGQAYERYVVINGQFLTPDELAILDVLNGAFIPNGRYWVDPNTGAWGYEGGPALGVLGETGYTETPSNQECTSYDCVKDSFCIENPGVC